MFHFLKPFDKIFVTGPQRSGTTICAKMIAHDLGHPYIDENYIEVHSVRLLEAVISVKKRFVMHCPAMSWICHKFKDIATVFMIRPVHEIVASERRIRWLGASRERAKYPVHYAFMKMPVSQMKYKYWEEIQKGVIKHGFEIDYHNLASHPLWIPKQGRKLFKSRQTRR